LEFTNFDDDSTGNITLLYNDTTTHALPAYLSLFLNAYYPAADNQTITVTSEPWAYAQGQERRFSRVLCWLSAWNACF
jgi:hypothetical protein